MSSVITEIEKRTREHPDKLLFAFLDIRAAITESYTYREFDQRTKEIAAYIQTNYALSQGDRVLLAYPSGLEMICAFFASVRLGLIPVPVYPPSTRGLEASVEKMNFIAQDCDAKAVLTDRSCYWSYKVNVSRKKTGVSALEWIISEDSDPAISIDLPEVQNEILFLQYTSGSTNDPKGVMVTHENCIQNCKNVVDHMPVGVSWLPQYHDMGLIGYYLFFALKGGTTYGFSPADFIQRPALWLEAITKFQATASSAPNFAYEYCLIPGKIPENTLEWLDLSSLTFLMTAAEPIKPFVYEAFLAKFEPFGLKPESFFGAYGLAEFTLAVTNYGRKEEVFSAELLKKGKALAISGKDESASGITLMSCGKALSNTEIRIVTGENGNRQVPEGNIGEIWLSGPSKCKGYWGRPSTSEEVFEGKLFDEAGTWLRTGDLGFLHNSELYVCGRLKDMIILRGSNYYPQDIEAIIERSSLVRAGCVAAFAVEKSGIESLVVVVGVKSNTGIPDAKMLHLKVNQYLGISISEIVFVPARTVSKTSSGKLKRYEVKEKYQTNELLVISHSILDEITDSNGSGSEGFENSEAGTNSGYQRLFSKYQLKGTESAVLGDAGLDSMKLAEFGHDLKAHLEMKGFADLSNEVDLKLLQRIAVSELFEILTQLDHSSRFARFQFRKAFSGIRAEYNKSESMLMARDALFQGHNQLNSEVQKNDLEQLILLTGGTGFFGPFLISSLLEQTRETIYVLVREDSVSEGMDRLRKAFHTIDPPAAIIRAFEERIRPIYGDLSKPKLGLSEKDWEFLAREIHTIYHNGAYVNYMMDYESMRQINVGGTREIIELCLTDREKVLNYISTTFIFGWSAKDTLRESDSNAAMEFLDFGYSQSKWVADQLVLKAMNQGLKARIFRPALISPSSNGKGYNFDISIRLLSFMLKYGIGTSAENQVSFTPANLAANNMVAISGLDESIGLTFHVTRDEYSTMQDVTDILAGLAGKSFENYTLKNFVPEVVSRCQKQDLLFPLLNFLVRSVDHISSMEFKRYDNSNYQKFRSLSPWGKADLPLEEVVNGIFLFMMNNPEIADSLNDKWAVSLTNMNG
jgi:thioester reductase-like protein